MQSFNGAATLSLRKFCVPVPSMMTIAMLQWGRNFIVAEIRELWFIHGECRTELQWGRNFIVAEMRPNGFKLKAAKPASMGPQLYRCGNAYVGGQLDLLEVASMGPQLYRCGNAYVGGQLDLLEVASMGPQLYRCGNHDAIDVPSFSYVCFNGAATLSLRKYGTGKTTQVEAVSASMGPQLYRCGNQPQAGRADVAPYGFNGAATLSLRKSV